MMLSLSTVFAHHGGFGLNLNLLDTNIINLVIVIGVLVWFLRGFLGGMLERRRQTILAELSDAEERLKVANAAVAQAQKDLARLSRRLSRSASMARLVPRLFVLKASAAPSKTWHA